MKTREVIIRTPFETSNQHMTEAEIDAYVNARKTAIREFFKWENYPKGFTHLLVAIRYDGNKCNIYDNGYLMDDFEFDTRISNRKDIMIESAVCYHKGTAQF